MFFDLYFLRLKFFCDVKHFSSSYFLSTFGKSNLTHLKTDVMFSGQRFAILAMFLGDFSPNLLPSYFMKSTTQEGGQLTDSVVSRTKSNQVGPSSISSRPRRAWRDEADLRLDVGRLGYP